MNLKSGDLSQTLRCEIQPYINYLGDYPLDQIPSIESILSTTATNTSFIVNTDKSTEPGSHWFAVVVQQQQQNGGGYNSILIEPMGLDNLLIEALTPLKHWCKTARVTQYLPYAIQPLNSTLCGAYCALILSRLPLYNYNLNQLTCAEFSRDYLTLNESRVASWWYKRRDACA